MFVWVFVTYSVYELLGNSSEKGREQCHSGRESRWREIEKEESTVSKLECLFRCVRFDEWM